MSRAFRPRTGRLLLVGVGALLALGLLAALVALLFGEKKAELTLSDTPLAPGQAYLIDGDRITYVIDNLFHEYRVGKSGMNVTELGSAISGYDIRGDNMAVFIGDVLQISGLEQLRFNGTIHRV